MICKKCGAQLPDGTEMCEFCGADLIEEQPEDEIIETQEEIEEEVLDENEIKRREQMQKMMEEKQLQLSEIERRRNSKKRRQQQTKIAIVCAVCVACIAAVGFGSYAVKESAKRPKPTPVAVVTTAPSIMPVVTPVATINTVTPAPLGSAAPVEEAKNSSWKASDTGNGNNASGGASNGGGSNTANSNASSGGSSVSSGSSKSNNTSANASNSGKTSSSSGGATNNSSSSGVKTSGAATDKITSELTKGGEVLYNNDTGKHLMTFTMNNTLYYANVSEGSTTEQIKDKNITISAYPTGERYKGNTIYEITKMTYYENAGSSSSDYVIPNSGTKVLTNDDIKGLSKEQLAIARNEIYARHGRKFQMAEYKNYFSQKSWYKENPNYNYSNENSNLNDIETKNVVFLLSAESRR